MKSAYSVYSGMISINITIGRIFLDRVARAIDDYITIDFLTNKSPFRGSRAVKLVVREGKRGLDSNNLYKLRAKLL
jgi:hypothetical protein